MGVSDSYGSYGSYGSSLGILKFFADVDETRCDKDDVNEDGAEAAGGKDDSKYNVVRWSMSFVNC